MISKNIEIINKLGLHARASSKLVQLANTFGCNITIAKNDKCANAKSIMSVMMLAANRGSQVVNSADGIDEEKALNALCTLIASKFGEQE